MGIPLMFLWISKRYPKIVQKAEVEESVTVDGEHFPIDCTKPNPNEIEYDNLYLDMNGIVHPCAHPMDGPQPQSEADIFKAVFEYVDHIFSIVRPRKVVYMAVDGVAPRAKMN